MPPMAGYIGGKVSDEKRINLVTVSVFPPGKADNDLHLVSPLCIVQGLVGHAILHRKR